MKPRKLKFASSLALLVFLCATQLASAFYDPSLGRWLTRDPIEERDGNNLYAFVHSNPVTAIDSLGLSTLGLKKIHGNWCGSDWTGGLVQEYDPNGGPYLAPIDALDSACEVHDKCYFNCRQSFPCKPGGRSSCFRGCDNALAAAAFKFGGAAGNAVGIAMKRPGGRDPGPNSPCCNGSK